MWAGGKAHGEDGALIRTDGVSNSGEAVFHKLSISKGLHSLGKQQRHFKAGTGGFVVDGGGCGTNTRSVYSSPLSLSPLRSDVTIAPWWHTAHVFAQCLRMFKG